MAAPTIHVNGIGGVSGAAIASLSPLYATGDVWYVSSVIGTDAVSPAGRDRVKPLASMAQAHANAAAGDIIVLLSGHVETSGAVQTFNKADIKVVGEGSGTSRPKFTRTTNAVFWDVTAAGVWIWNVYFTASITTSSALSRLRFAGVADVCRDCYFECGALDTGPALETITGASQVVIRDTTFASTATALASQPGHAIKITNAITDLDMDAVTMDGGTTGWSNQAAFNGAAAVTRLRAINIDQLNDSDATMASGTTGYWVPRNKSGSARVVWTP